MEENKRRQLARSFVVLGFGDIVSGEPFRSLDFLTDAVSTSEAQDLIRLVKSYNAFDGERVASALERFRGRVGGWKFGRCGSPLLHVELPYWTHQVEETLPGTQGARISQENHEALMLELQQTFVDELEADVFETIDDSEHEVRIWWD